MLSKVSANDTYMHYFQNLSSACGGFAARPPRGLCITTPLADFPPNLPTPAKNPAAARGHLTQAAHVNMKVSLSPSGIV